MGVLDSDDGIRRITGVTVSSSADTGSPPSSPFLDTSSPSLDTSSPPSLVSLLRGSVLQISSNDSPFSISYSEGRASTNLGAGEISDRVTSCRLLVTV